MKLIHFLCLSLYYLIAIRIPEQIGGNKVRGMLTRVIFKESGENITIRPYVSFGLGNKLVIGNNSVIGLNSKIHLSDKVVIGSDVIIGPELAIMTANHSFDKLDLPIRQQGSYTKPVIIEDDVWIGMRVIILSGVTVGKGAVVGAGSVVTKNVEPYTIVAGNPAKVIRKRSKAQG